MTATKSIVPQKGVDDQSWGQMIDDLVLELESADLPEPVIQAIEYLLTGHSIHETARKLDVTPATVRGWISRYPIMASILEKNRESLIRWRMAKLEGQFLQAVNRSQELLDVELTPNSGVSPKMYGAVAQHVRFILSLFAGQKVDVHVTHEVGSATLNAAQEALDYIAEQLSRQREEVDLEPIETTYRVIDAKFDSGPLLDEHGQSHYGQIGILDSGPDGSLCHLCGKRYKGLDQHIQRQHNLTVEEYETIFMLETGSIRNARRKDQ